MTATLRIQNLHVCVEGTPSLQGVNLQIRQGEIHALMGPNGSGKTTSLKLFLGLLFPTEGEISILGKPAVDVEKNERIGYLPEESYLYRFLNAEEILALQETTDSYRAYRFLNLRELRFPRLLSRQEFP